VRPYVVSHLNAKLQNWQWAGIYFFQEKSRNVHRIAGLLIKCNSFAESPNLVQRFRLTKHMVGGVGAGLAGFDGWLFPGEPRRWR
jgi:hypothetical protein